MNFTSRLRVIGVVLALLLSCSSANAELVSIDLVPGSGDQLLLHDTETGLDWLDVAQTANQNYDQVRAGIWYQMGFRHATTDQARALFLHAGVPDDGFDTAVTHPAEAAALIGLLGVTIVGDEGREGTWGLVGDDLFGNFITLRSHPIGQVFDALLGKVDHFPAVPSLDIPEAGEGHFTGGSPFSDEANPLWGSFLVRAHLASAGSVSSSHQHDRPVPDARRDGADVGDGGVQRLRVDQFQRGQRLARGRNVGAAAGRANRHSRCTERSTRVARPEDQRRSGYAVRRSRRSLQE